LFPAYVTVDLRVEWKKMMASRFDVAKNVTNLIDKLYFLGNTGNAYDRRECLPSK